MPFVDFGFGKKAGKGFKKRADNCGDTCSCGGCDLFLIGKVLTLFALQAPPRSHRPSSLGSRTGLRLIRLYQKALSPRLPTRCRYEPSCSRYGYQAVQRYGLVTGARLIAGRISRCTRSTPYGTPDPLS
nr:membrane protein insertion efficiency factor YidD [Kineosporia babensis]